MKNHDKGTAKKKSKETVPFAILDEMVDDMAGQHAEILDRFKKAAQQRKKAAKGKPSTSRRPEQQ